MIAAVNFIHSTEYYTAGTDLYTQTLHLRYENKNTLNVEELQNVIKGKTKMFASFSFLLFILLRTLDFYIFMLVLYCFVVEIIPIPIGTK